MSIGWKKTDLRRCARRVLEQRGYRVENMKTPGVLPGARLRAIKGTDVQKIAVRTSFDREVGLTRQPDGRWITMSKVDQVFVVVPASDLPDAAEVFGFTPQILISAFDAALAAWTDNKGKLAPKVPIFIALDTPERGAFDPVMVGLKDNAEWREVVTLSREGSERESTMAFIERVKREYADRNGVDVGNVSVEFRIKA